MEDFKITRDVGDYGIPCVIVHCGMSIDGRVAPARGHSVPKDAWDVKLYLDFQRRLRCDAAMVGSSTVLELKVPRPVDSLDDEFLLDRVKTLLSLQDGPDLVVERLPETLTRSVLDWRQEHIRSLVDEVKYMFGDASTNGDKDQREMLGRQLLDLTVQLKNINQARAAMSSTSRWRSNNSLTGD